MVKINEKPKQDFALTLLWCNEKITLAVSWDQYDPIIKNTRTYQ